MKNIDTSMGTSSYKDERPTQHYLRFSADFENEEEKIAFHIELLHCISRFNSPDTSIREEMEKLLRNNN